MKNDIIKICDFLDLYHKIVKISYIRKLPNGKYRVYSEKGKNLGTYNSKEEAKKRLRQIEFFKHKKASDNRKDIDLSNIDAITYSAIVRNLKKNDDNEILLDFLSMYKKCFDKLVSLNSKEPAECALPDTLISLSNKYNFKLPKQK